MLDKRETDATTASNVPSSCDVVRIAALIGVNASSETKIAQLQNVIGGYEQIFCGMANNLFTC